MAKSTNLNINKTPRKTLNFTHKPNQILLNCALIVMHIILATLSPQYTQIAVIILQVNHFSKEYAKQNEKPL